ncbi:MAG: alpha/beta hydrolase [Proteobacteria bacterium]|nr:alpha/beta hydrolase [Pseudomonadota bacterium]
MLLTLQRRIVFPRHLTHAAAGAGDGVEALERLWIDTEEGRVEAWLLPGEGVGPTHPGPAVIFAHGNAELIDEWPQILQPYRRLGISVLLPEYRGYGRSAGSPSQAAIGADFARFYDQLAARPEVDAARIVLHGRSLGGGVVCQLAEQREVAAVILMSTFSSVHELAKRFWVPSFLLRDPFDNRAAIARLQRPVLIVHGRQDTLIPVDHARVLAAAATRGRLVLYDGDHNTCPPDWTVFWRDLEQFLRASTVLVP